jgi:hypothetical protein
MTALNFKAQFAPLVESGQKRQTIRRAGKHKAPKVGEELQLYTGQRTNQCRLLGTGICTLVKRVIITPNDSSVAVQDFGEQSWRYLESNAISNLAKADGFAHLAVFFDFFYESNREKDVSSFHGYIIRWELKP